VEDLTTAIFYDDSEFIITKRRWIHFLEHHPELHNSVDIVLEAVSKPDEVYVDPRGM
jgi:hypothetical protein